MCTKLPTFKNDMSMLIFSSNQKLTSPFDIKYKQTKPTKFEI